jgi:uroporphyrinogen III methyltransferase/synthase
MSNISSTNGIVYIVGGGPGDPGLITVKGLECLRRADVVLYDRLIAQELLTEVPIHAELIDVGKEPKRHRRSQDEINALLIEKAREGKIVVRLKGGDPFVFGRGGEECSIGRRRHSYEVVLSKARLPPAYAGICDSTWRDDCFYCCRRAPGTPIPRLEAISHRTLSF